MVAVGNLTVTSGTSGTSATYLAPVTYVSSGGTWTTNPAPRALTPLEWLDAEIERTCAKAQLAA